MKRDMELIRELMLRLEELPINADDGIVLSAYDGDELQFEGYSAGQVHYHMDQLYRSGYLDSGADHFGFDENSWMFSRLTPSGHDFIDSIRDPEVWRRTKEGASKAGGWTLGVIKDLGLAYLKHVIKERTGVDLS
jgi:hypothetical protein